MRTPTKLHVNGYLTVDGAKMSKSRGTFVMAKTYVDAGLPTEALRYYYATKTNGGVDDLDLNLGDFVARVNSDLVGKFVNIASRCAGFIAKQFDGRLSPTFEAGRGAELYAATLARRDAIVEAYAANNAAAALRNIMEACDEANAYVADSAPWVLAKQTDDETRTRLQAVCTTAINLFRLIAAYLKPVLPNVAAQAEAFLGTPVSRWSDLDAPLLDHAIQSYAPLFTRIDPKQIDAMTEASKDSLQPAAPAVAGGASAPSSSAASSKKLAAETAPTKCDEAKAEAPKSEYIGIEDFAKLDLRIGKVLECGFVEGSDKLLRFKLDAGDLGERQIFSGIRASYGEPEKLVGRSVVFIANLAPRKMRFGLSEGMILSAGFDGGALALLDADSGAEPGMPVR
jgi:methionyl-tRNA synthetase